MADIAGLRQKLSQAENKAQQAQAEYDRLKAAANSLNFGRDANGQVLDVEGFRAARAAASAFKTSTLDPALVDVDDASQALRQAESTVAAPAGTVSAGQTVVDDQAGRANNSTTQNPQEPFVQSSTGLNVLPEDEIEFGTDGRIRRIEETQATPAAPPGFARPGDEDAAQAPFTNTQQGVGAQRDDNTRKNSLSVQQTINANFSQRIDPRPNILDEYASYTYSLTWYVLTPEQFNQMQAQARKNISGWQILVQSGGAATAPGNGLPGRNEFFSNDYYLDNLVIETAIAGKGTGTAANATELSFTVTEPNGFTLIENLFRAVSTLYKKNKLTGNYVDATYCMCIRFYGYNEFGELIQVGRSTNPGGGSPGATVTTDNRAVVEKFIPFRLNTISTKIANKVIEYQVKAAGVGTSTALSSQRGTIPFQYELAGSTVGELLNGRPVGTKYSRTDGRVSTDSPPSNNPTSPVNPGNQAGVNELGNFTGTTENPFTVVAP
jgi:hypothetical protein